MSESTAIRITVKALSEAKEWRQRLVSHRHRLGRRKNGLRRTSPGRRLKKRLRHGAGEPGPTVRDNPADGGRGSQSGIPLQYPRQKGRLRGGRRPCRPAPYHSDPRPAQPMLAPKVGKPSGGVGCFRSYLQPPPRTKDRCRSLRPRAAVPFFLWDLL